MLWVRVVCGQRASVYAWALSLPVSDKASPCPLTLPRLCYRSRVPSAGGQGFTSESVEEEHQGRGSA